MKRTVTDGGSNGAVKAALNQAIVDTMDQATRTARLRLVGRRSGSD